jgi:hypothetical protein
MQPPRGSNLERAELFIGRREDISYGDGSPRFDASSSKSKAYSAAASYRVISFLEKY